MDMEDRVARLETSNRRLKISLVACLGACLLIFGTGQVGRPHVPDVVQARKFEVIGQEGEVMVRLASEPEYGTINTYDKSGWQSLFSVGSQAFNDGEWRSGLISIKDTQNRTPVRIGSMFENGYLALERDKQIGLMAGGDSGLSIYRGDHAAIVLRAGRSRELIRLHDTNQNQGVSLGFDEAGSGLVRVANRRGEGMRKLIADAPAGNSR